jgi:hypothetical protein
MRQRVPLISLAVALLASPAAAQPENPYGGGTRLEKPPEMTVWPTDQSRPILADFAQCVVKRTPDLARALVLLSTSIDFESRYMPLFNADCFSSALRRNAAYGAVKLEMSRWRGRTIIAAALVNQDLANFDANQIKSAAPIPRLTISPEGLSATKPKDKEALLKEQEDVILDALGQCVVRANPVNAQILLRSKINSDEEMQAIQGLVPNLRACVDKGSQFKLDRESLRGVIALNFYRLAYAPRTEAAR